MTKLAKTNQWLTKKTSALYLAAAILAVGFGLFTIITAQKVNVEYPLTTALIFGAIYFLAQAMLISRKSFDAFTLFVGSAFLACVIFARVSLLYYVSDDYEFFLDLWVKKLASLPVKEALSTPVGDYNMPYLYILLVFSRLNIDSMLLIKSLSCVFDVVLAFFVMKIVALGIKDRRLQLMAFLLTLAAPTVMINSAQWSQCDSIYVSFILISMYAALQGRGRLCSIMWTIAFCFKLQAVFILPALGIMLFAGKVKVRHLIWIPLIFIGSLLPAMLAGRSFASCLSIYANQTQSYGFLFHNAPTIWRFFEGADFESFSVVSVFVAGAAVILFIYICMTFLKELRLEDFVKIFFLSAMLVPYLLPRMHDRYFYMADILALIYFMYDRRKWYIPVVLILSSVISYMYYFTEIVIIDQKYLSVAFIIILATETRELFKKFWHNTPDTVIIE